MAIQSFRDLEAWRRSMTLVERCYAGTQDFPNHEQFGLTGQLRRAAVSIPSNVAEGSCRPTTRAFINHVGIALGSLAEVETCIEIGLRLGYLSQEVARPLFDLTAEAGRLLNGLMRALRAKRNRRSSSDR